MKIAFVTGVFPKLSETFVINQITGLIDRGHNVTIFANTPKGEEKVHPDVVEYDLVSKTVYWPESGGGLKNLGAGLKRLSSQGLSAAKTVLHESHGDFDVIYCHFGHVAESARKLREGGVFSGKLVAVFHAWDITVNLNENGEDFYDQFFPEVDLMLPISHLWAAKLERLGGDPAKIKVHRMGIDCDRFEFRERTPPVGRPTRLVSIARLVDKKGIEIALRALGEVKRAGLKFEYTIAGDGPLKASLEKIAREVGVAEHVNFGGWMDQSEIVALLDDADVLLLPSVTADNGDMEGLPVVLMEGCARGLPVVATRHSGIPELVKDGECGLLTEERDVVGLTAALKKMLSEPERWADYGAAGRQVVEQEFSIESLNDELDRLLRALVA